MTKHWDHWDRRRPVGIGAKRRREDKIGQKVIFDLPTGRRQSHRRIPLLRLNRQ
ncbi:MAG: hypothetical protein LGR52_13190 [Candidatus Thiosymbion ectosymbiont of Robbea hypermnestra]|nr:hypothetical protein [Candidatus Thiosymbion ectosymbiont of Robbea hypermnestra]